MRTPKSGGTKKAPPAKKDAAAAAATAAAATAAPSSETTPEKVAATAAAKATPKSGSGTKASKGAGKRAAPRSAAATAGASSAAASNPVVPATASAAEAIPDLKPDGEVEDMAPTDAKVSSALPSHVEASAEEVPVGELKDAKDESALKSGTPGTLPPPVEVDKRVRPAVVSNEQKEAETPGKVEETVDDTKKEGERSADPEAKSGIEESLIEKEEESVGKVVSVEAEEHEDYVDQEGAGGHGDEETLEEREDEEGVKDEEEATGLKEEEQVEMLDMIKERKKKKEHEIFVGGLDRDATEEDVRKVFEKIGEVVDVRLQKDFTTNKNKGFAFVKFATKEQASRALSELKNPIIHGKRCGIAPSEDNDTLFLGNICNTWTKEAIKQRLKDYGVEGVENITLVGDTQNEGLSRGFAFLEFSCHEYAMNAYKRLQKPDVVFGHTQWSAKVAFAEPLREPDPEVMAQVKSVFVDGMPPYWDEDRVKEQFNEYGEIEGIVLARNMPTAKRRDFGFVNYTTHEAAVACVEAVNNTELGDGKSKMKVRARLANPLPKIQAVKGGMRGGFRIGHAGIGGFSRFGRGFGRGRLPLTRGGFHSARGFHFRGRGRGGRFPFPNDNMFRGRQPFGVRGGGRGFFRGTHEGVNDDFSPRLDIGRSRRGAFVGGNRPFHPRREAFAFEGDFNGPIDGGHFAEDPYYYSDIGRGIKRPFSVMEHDSRYLESGSRVRSRYDLADPLSGGALYRDPMGSAGDIYSHDYYGSDYGGSGYSSMYGGEHAGGRYYY